MGPPIACDEKRPPRVSDHSRQSLTATPSASTGTVDPHCPVIPTPARPVGSATFEAMSERTPSRMQLHHSDVSCTAPPSGMYRVLTEPRVCPSNSPCSDTAPVFGPPVPRSIARNQGSRGTLSIVFARRHVVHCVECRGEERVEDLV